MSQTGFYINMNRCSACKVCVIACKDVNDLKVGYNFRHVDEYEGGINPSMWAASISLACNHCEEPACMAICPASAIHKEADTGLVVIDQNVCTGCQSCVTACPYGAPVYFPDKNKVNKCHGCRGMIALGEKPACVAACSTRCLDFGDLGNLKAKYGYDLVDTISVLPEPETGPSLLIDPKAQLRV
jgi:anaerobic dimethyl sulfoxide reductase subunit B (iron-sulfur subunit)